MSATVAIPTRETVMAQARSENFPVASRLLPRRVRGHLLAVYGFARLVDDIGDEAPGDRLALLDWAEQELDRVYVDGRPGHPVMRALVPAVRDCALPKEPFRRLIEANRRDQHVTRYDSFEELLGYCELSAAPVGELVLHVFGAATPERIALSDRICAALQVTEHLQDLDEDRERGRHYISDPARAAQQARALYDAGAPLARDLPLRARLAVAAFLAGGRAALAGRGRVGFVTGLPRAVMGR